MSEFEFVFALFSLVFGLSLVELLTGLGRTLEFRLQRQADGEPFRIGWLTPLLAVFVILDLLSFWMFAWPIQRLITVSTPMVLGVVVFSGAYFLASRLVFPSRPDDFVDLDTHYFRVHRIVFAMLIIMVIVQWLFILSIPALATSAVRPLVLVLTGVLLALMLAAGITRNRTISTIVLTLLIARYLVIYLI